MRPAERTKLIKEKKSPTGKHFRVWAKDIWQEFEIVRVPVEALQLNVDNRRFKAERQVLEGKLGHPLDPENSPDDEQSVISILLDSSHGVDGDRVVGKPSKNYDALRKDWTKRKQETPFWVRPDGTVRNGNRRLAMLKRLQVEEGADGYEWVETIILDPKEYDEKDVFEMEQREQLTENLKVRYTDINLLLALKEAADLKNIDWNDPDSIEQVAGDLQHIAGADQSYAVIQLQAIRYMDVFLDYMNAAGQHEKLLRQVERFRDVGKIMSRMEAEYHDEAPDMLKLAFAAIRAGNPHGDIRQLWKIFTSDRARYDDLVKQIDGDEEDSSKSGASRLENPTDLPPDPDVDDAEPPGPNIANYPADKIRSRIKNAIDAFVSASSDDIRSALEQAFNRLEALTDDRARLATALADKDKGGEVAEILRKIVAWAEVASGLLPKSKGATKRTAKETGTPAGSKSSTVRLPKGGRSKGR